MAPPRGHGGRRNVMAKTGCSLAIRCAGCLALGLGLSIGLTRPASAGVSVGGSINPLPSASTVGVGDVIDVTLGLTNTTQTTPPDPFAFLPATLEPGTTFVFQACQDS